MPRRQIITSKTDRSTFFFPVALQGWGKTIVLGVASGAAAPISIPSYEILRGRSVVGSLFGGLKPKTDVPLLAQKYLDEVR